MSNIKYFCKGVYIRARTFDVQKLRASGLDKKKLLYPFRELLHPLDAFSDLKYENKSSMLIADALAFLFFLVKLLEGTCMGYLFQSVRPQDVNIWSILGQSVGMVLLWSVCNWATCTLIDGEGSMRDVWVMTTYSLVPYILFSLIANLCSQIFSQSEMVFFTSIQFLGTLWTGILLFLGMLTAHQFTVTKTILSVIFTLLTIAACCFLLLLFFTISQQFYNFVYSVIKEMLIR